MDTRQIRQYMRQDVYIRRQLGDVCAVDRLPMQISRRSRIYIVNTDESNRPGDHWVACYFPRQGPTEFFDSNGYGPDHYHRRFKRVLLKNGRYYRYNPVKVQSAGTMTCGHFCLYYAYYRCHGYTMKQIIDMLGDPQDNESFVIDFVKCM